MKTVEKISGIRMDHYMEIDFAGFKELVDAIGGVDVTVDQPCYAENASIGAAGSGYTPSSIATRRFRARSPTPPSP